MNSREFHTKTTYRTICRQKFRKKSRKRQNFRKFHRQNLQKFRLNHRLKKTGRGLTRFLRETARRTALHQIPDSSSLVRHRYETNCSNDTGLEYKYPWYQLHPSEWSTSTSSCVSTNSAMTFIPSLFPSATIESTIFRFVSLWTIFLTSEPSSFTTPKKPDWRYRSDVCPYQNHR